jgi:hypothetical protein
LGTFGDALVRGFQAWSKNLRVKELKPETALTAINEVKTKKNQNQKLIC